MAWVFLAFALIVIAVYVKWMRFLLIAVAALAALLVFYMFLQNSSESREFEASKHRLRADQVTFEDLVLKPDYGSSYRLTGRIHNNSSLNDFLGAQLEITMQDCSRNCETVGQTTIEVRTLIPKLQARGLEEHVYFSSLPATKGQYEWHYRVIYLRGR